MKWIFVVCIVKVQSVCWSGRTERRTKRTTTDGWTNDFISILDRRMNEWIMIWGNPIMFTYITELLFYSPTWSYALVKLAKGLIVWLLSFDYYNLLMISEICITNKTSLSTIHIFMVEYVINDLTDGILMF